MIHRETMDIRQKIIAATTSQGWRAPHAAYIHEADVTDLILWLSKINNTGISSKITLNTLLVYIIVSGIKSCPAVNAHVHYHKWFTSGSVTLIDRIDINMPVILPNGKMMTVKLSDFGNRKLSEMQDYIKHLMEKIKNTDMDVIFMKTALYETFQLLKKGDVVHPLGRLIGLKLGKNRITKIPKASYKKYISMPIEERINIQDINIGTLTISNMGAALKNMKGFPALIDVISPQVFAVGIGPIYDDTVVSENNASKTEISFRKKLKFCLVFDHRALDFGDIVPFIKKIDSVCNNPEVYIECAFPKPN
jgi:pyruvate dehydrogenase E2 component (dihydrolipoamide acetyltransferase)